MEMTMKKIHNYYRYRRLGNIDPDIYLNVFQFYKNCLTK